MERAGGEDNADGPAFVLELDRDNCLWAHSLPREAAAWGVNLGPVEAAMGVMADFLAQRDFGD